MLKQLFSTTLITLLAVGVANAQKVDLDKRTFSVEYVSLPSNNALAAFENYSVEVVADQETVNQLGLTPANINSYVQLEGFSYTTAQGDFTYSVKIEKAQVLQENVEERKEDEKNPDGSVKSVSRYVAVVRIAIPTTLTIKSNKDGKTIVSSVFSTTDKPTVFQSGAQDSKERAQNMLSNLKERGMNSSARDIYVKTLQAETNKIKKTYTFGKYTAETMMWEINEKKAPELAEFNQQLTKAVASLSKLSYKESVSKVKEEMVPVLQYWVDNAKSINATEKSLRKLKYGHLFNLAKSQYFLEMFDDCEKTCQMLIENDYDKSDGRTILDDVKSVKESLAKSGQTSRHLNRSGFDSKTSYAYVPGAVAVAPAKLSFIEQTKKDNKEVKDAFADVGKTVKNDFVRKTVKDTINQGETDLSDLKLIYNGKEITLKHNQLANGSGFGTPDEKGHYDINFVKSDLWPSYKETSFFVMNIYPHAPLKPGSTADNMLQFIKDCSNKDIYDINVNEGDKIDYYINKKEIPSKVITPQQYQEKLSMDIRMDLKLKDNPGLNDTYVTNTGDKFKVQLVSAVPLKIKPDPSSVQKMESKGYLVTLLIPELTLNRRKCAEPWCFLNGETIKVQNVTCTFVMLSKK